MKRLSCLLSGLIFFVFCQTAFAIEAPSKKPPNPFRSSVLNRSDAERLYLGLQAARDSDWNAVRSYRDGISDPTARKLLFWRMASSSLSDADFQTLDRALSDLEGWPGTRELRIRAEEEISASTLPPSEQVNWLEASGPISGEGKLALGKAYMALGRTSDAEEMIKSAWHGHAFLISRQSEIARTYAEILDPEDHVKRTDYLLWTSQRSAAQAMKSYLSPGWDRLVDARIGLAVRAGNVDGLINAVPSELQMNPGLLYERSYWRRRKDRWEDAREPLLQINPDGLPTVALGKIWDEKNLHLRRAIRDDEWQDAYMLSSTHGLTEGVDFANGEFYAGWVALRFLDRPQDALRHFQTLENGVGSAISLSRAQFWVGEAYSALGQRAEAEAAWRRAAEHITYFYAQRAAERLGQTTITLPAVVIPTEDERARFENLELVRVLRMLAEAGEDYQFRRISYELDDQLTTIAEYELLFELAESYELTQAGVRGAKAAIGKGLVPTHAAFPKFNFTIPNTRSTSADPALVMAITRQETEMNQKAISPARANGYMQLLDGTARNQARIEGLSYRWSWLLDDPEYNVRLGRSFLSDMIDRFNGSYIMAISAYNAGPSRPPRWMSEYGDPRAGEIDPIDYIESIPFSETRNYVQRVLENTQVYRAVLAGGSAPLMLEADLLRGQR